MRKELIEARSEREGGGVRAVCARVIVTAWFFLGKWSLCSASGITYSVNETIGPDLLVVGQPAPTFGSVVGTITTDGTIGVLSNQNGQSFGADILGWNLVVTDAGRTWDLVSNICQCTSIAENQGSDLSATATQLLFNFSDTASAYFFFEQGSNAAVC